MRRSRSRFLAALVAVGVLLTVLAPSADAWWRPGGGKGEHGGQAEVLLSGLSSPKGLDTFLGQPVVAQGAFGPPGPVLLHATWPFGRGKTIEVTDPLNLVDVAVAPNGSAWLLGSDQVLYRKTIWSDPEPVVNIAEYQATDPDPDDLEGNPTESNPYGLAVLPNGDALVADAAGNDIVRVTRHGQVSTFARFAPEVVATDHLPGFPEPAIPAESVPTSIAIGRDGVYVGELKGFPFRPGSSNIYKIGLHASGAQCSAQGPSDDCVVADTGYTAIQDIAIDRWSAKTYVYELAADGVLAFEAGFETGVFPPAVLLEVRHGTRRELAAGQLSQPGGVATGLFGGLFVTDGVFGDGRLLQIRR
jgi:hypothetical protein